jgi:hypothetical protein
VAGRHSHEHRFRSHADIGEIGLRDLSARPRERRDAVLNEIRGKTPEAWRMFGGEGLQR